MSEWRTRLTGQIDDLRFRSVLFPDGEVAVVEDDGVFFLASLEFSGMSDPDKVRALARDILDTINASTDAASDGFLPVAVDAIEKLFDDGQRLTTGFRSVVGAQNSTGWSGCSLMNVVQTAKHRP